MAVYHFQNEYINHYSVSDSDIVHFLGNYAGCAEPMLIEEAEKELSEEKLQEGFDTLFKDVRRVLYEDFKKVKSLDSYDDKELARSIMFPNSKDEDNYFRNAMIVIVKVLAKLQKELGQYKGEHLCREIFGSEAAFLHQVLFQICEFADMVAARQEGNPYGGLYSRKHRFAMETYRMAREIPRGRLYNNDIAHFSEAIFLIRQTIELKVIEILQLAHVWNTKCNREVKVAPDAFLDILDNDEVKFIDALSGEIIPVDIKYIKKVHLWTNMFIHTGHTYWTWEVEFVRDSIADFAMAQVEIGIDYRKSFPERIMDCIKDEERNDAVVMMTKRFYEDTKIPLP